MAAEDDKAQAALPAIVVILRFVRDMVRVKAVRAAAWVTGSLPGVDPMASHVGYAVYEECPGLFGTACTRPLRFPRVLSRLPLNPPVPVPGQGTINSAQPVSRSCLICDCPVRPSSP